jgi:hypothetical protein
MATIGAPVKLSRNPERIDWNARVHSVLSSNAKIEKTPAGVLAINSGISLAPARRSGWNVCEFATAGCIMACVLWFAGRTMSAVVRAAAIARTNLLRFNPAAFYDRLREELAEQQARADKAGARSFARLNAASDILHPRFVFDSFPRTTFYDYCKGVSRVLSYLRGELAPNYHIALSVHENSRFDDVKAVLELGGNVIVVVDSYYWGQTKRFGTLPAVVEFRSADGSKSIVVDGFDADIQDIRIPEFDGRGRCGCLRLKSQSNKVKEGARKSGFARWFEFGGREFSQRFVHPENRGRMIVDLK